MASATTKGRKTAASKKASAKASPTSTPKRAGTSKASGSTRTSSRSAKRRSPKEAADERLDGELSEVERVEFLRAMDAYKRKTGQTFPSWTEVLDVLRDIGWQSPTRLAAMKDAEAA